MDLGLFCHFVQLRARERMEYRGAYLLGIGAQVIGWGGDYAVMTVLLHRFPELNGWRWHEVVFLFSLELFSYALGASFAFFAVAELERLVADGSLDSFLVRPLDPLTHLAARWFNLGYVAHVVIAGSFLAWSVTQLGINWQPLTGLYLLLAIAGATCLQAGAMILLGSLSFLWVRTRYAFVLYFNLKAFLSYPVTLYGVAVQWLLTLVLPLAFINFYPAALLLEKDSGLLFGPMLWAAPLVGPLVLLVAYRLFGAALARYQGAGG